MLTERRHRVDLTTVAAIGAEPGRFRANHAFKAANVLGGVAANNIRQYSCFRSKLI